MDYLNKSYLNWFEFIVLAAILYLIFFLVRKYKSRILALTDLHNLAIVNTILAVLVVLAFVAINPLYHFIIVTIAVLIGYSVLSDYAKGVVVATNSKLEVGDLIRVGEFKGKVASINLSGVKMLNEQANLFVPYKMFSNHTIEKFKSDQASFISFSCEADEELKGRMAIINLEKTLFDFPFTKSDSKIELRQEETEFHVNLTLANDRFKTSLFNQLEKAGFTIINKN